MFGLHRKLAVLGAAIWAFILGFGFAASSYTLKDEDKAKLHSASQATYDLGRLANGEQPTLIRVNLGAQRLIAYQGGNKIAESEISSGRRMTPTRPGIYRVLERKTLHFSRLFGGTPMPFMMRLDNNGLALHAGSVGSQPNSGGCIRLPKEFARALYRHSAIGLRVEIVR